MKTASITKLTLGLLIAGSIVACNQKKADSTAPAAAAPAEKQLVVYVNSDTLTSQYNYAKDIDAKLASEGKSAQADLQSKGEAFQREVADYQKGATAMPADQRQTTEQRLQREQQDLQTKQQNATAEFQNDRSTQYGKVFDKVSNYVKQYAKQKGYKLVLTYSKANPTVLYGDSTLDVTADVVKGLNDAYAKDGSK